MPEEVKQKKPFYKKWWVWVIAVVLILGALGGGEDTTTADPSPPQSANEEQQSAEESNIEQESLEESKNTDETTSSDTTVDTQNSDTQSIETTQSSDQNRQPSNQELANPPPSGQLTVHYIDVGQGDATLLKGSDFTVLIDAGRHDRNDVVPYLKSVGVNHIDLIVGTHPHADHIGQMDKVIQNFDVKEVWMSGDTHTTRTFERVIDAILASNASYHEPRTGENFVIGSLKIEVLHPTKITGDFHEGSISLRAVYGDIAFMFTGDAEAPVETAMIAASKNLKSHIFRLGHHGSRTSNTQNFLNAVNPEVAIYSAGAGNSYGHPHDEVINRIKAMGIDLYGTDVHGNIVVTTNGKTYSIATNKSGTISGGSNSSSQPTQSAPTPAPTPQPDPELQVQEPKPTTGSININTASREQLIEIIHIGEERVDDLIRHRPYSSVDQLDRISGIGPARVKAIKEQGKAYVD